MPLIDMLEQLPPSLAQAVRSGRATPDVLAGMLALLRERARPAVLVLDDLQWADGATLDLARYVGRRVAATRALLVLAWRDTGIAVDHPLRLVIGGLSSQHTQRFELAPLSATAVAELARRAGRSAEGLHAATGGNPFFVTEWLAGDGLHLPAAVRDAVLGRAAPLSAAARGLLELVAVAPAGLEVDVVDALVDDTSAALAECAAAGLLQRQAQLLRFRHELARQSVHAACEGTRLVELHGAVFDALSLRGAATARLVHHAYLASRSSAVAQLAPLAAREAARAGAHRQAAAHLALALSHAKALDEARRAELHAAHSRACLAIHRLEAALVSRHAALAIHCRLGDALAEGIDLREIARIEWFQGPCRRARCTRRRRSRGSRRSMRRATSRSRTPRWHSFIFSRSTLRRCWRRAGARCSGSSRRATTPASATPSASSPRPSSSATTRSTPGSASSAACRSPSASA